MKRNNFRGVKLGVKNRWEDEELEL